MQHRIVASYDLGKMSVEAPTSKSWSFGVHVFVFHVKPDWRTQDHIRDLVSCNEVEHGSVIDGKYDAHDEITDSQTPFQEVISHEGQFSGV
jgi:hypothetical protein